MINLAIFCVLAGFSMLRAGRALDRRKPGLALIWSLVAVFHSGFAAAEWIIDGVRA